ncbi:F0F1 ATP synthase subunit delta [Serpentinicella sp. ANB-PHB4]|uniref:F0F1 ATP synthase subunit delta n=1 Tax=Serpentinicella sp. ANB-PHB4 TaxID=3074076 RepID=UPI002855F35F|nr:F0F1 ATP synthase subunit delta [Serpentinicella sp. ANB-PHB4]MDR5659714.1 F0F1 ATP synthase subunit delta [Serpentinicella sp. ANB-PHB4]
MAELVANRYARALFDVAYESNKHKEVQGELESIVNILKAHPEFDELLKTPLVTSEEKKQVLSKVLEGKVSQEVQNFLSILLDKTRYSYIKDISKKFKTMCDAVENREEAVAITAIPMSEADISVLEQKLSSVTKKTVSLKNEVDTTVLGGVLIKMGDKVIDGTLKRRLGHVKQQLAEIII